MPDSPITDQAAFDREHLAGLISRERETYGQRHTRSRHAFAVAGANLLGGVPMTWMRMWPGGFPIYFAKARGARLSDIDGNSFIDFCLGDTGAMAGHSPAATVAAVTRRYGELGGAATMLPEPGYLAAVRDLTRQYGCLLINDETHTFSAGSGGCTRAWGLDPDIVTIGKSIRRRDTGRRVRPVRGAGRQHPGRRGRRHRGCRRGRRHAGRQHGSPGPDGQISRQLAMRAWDG